jgi:putative SOS response-associated peptidase YedK
MCNLYSITTNQAAIIALFRVINRYVGNLAPMPGVFPDYPAPVVRNAGTERELVMMPLGYAPAASYRRPASHQHPQHLLAALARLAQARKPLPCAVQQLRRSMRRSRTRNQEERCGLVCDQ